MTKKRRKQTELEAAPVEDVVVQVQVIPQTEEELTRQEEIVQRGTVDSIRALRTIREEKLYRFSTHKHSFDTYVQSRWHRTRQWATQEIQWLEVCEYVEKMFGKSIYHFDHSSVRALRKLMEYPEQFAWALKEVSETGSYFKSHVAKRRMRFVKWLTEWERWYGRGDRPPLQYKEFIALEVLEEEPKTPRRPAELSTAVKKSADTGRDLRECLVEECRAGGECLPDWKTLLQHFRCEELENVCLDLFALKTDWEFGKYGKTRVKERQESARKLIAQFRPDLPPGEPGQIIPLRPPVLASDVDDIMESLTRFIQWLKRGNIWNEIADDYAKTPSEGHVFTDLVNLNNLVEGRNDTPESIAV